MTKRPKYINHKEVKKDRITLKNVFNKPRYRNVIHLILIANEQKKKIKLSNLKYALVKKFKINDTTFKKSQLFQEKMEKFYIPPENDAMIKKLKMYHDIGELPEDGYKQNVSILKQGEIQHLKDFGWLNDKTYFPSDTALRKHIAKLIDLKIIKKTDDKKGYPYYNITQIGKIHYLRWFIHYLIDDDIPDDESILALLQGFIFKIALEKNNPQELGKIFNAVNSLYQS